MIVPLLYNLGHLAIDALVLGAIVRRKGRVVRLAVLAGGTVASGVLAVLLARDGFDALRLLCWGVFLHATGVLAIGGIFLVRRGAKGEGILAVALAFVGILAAIDAFRIEPTWLEVTRYEVRTAKLDRPVRIVVIADIQTDRVGAYERKVLERVMAEKPDLILLPGDFVQVDGPAVRAEVHRALREIFREIGFGAPLGAFAVGGNCDEPGWDALFEEFPVHVFLRTGSVDLAGESIRITGLDLNDSFHPGIRVPASDRFHIVTGHAPDFALGEVEADLLVAGHTHGGQVRLPFFGPPITLSRVPRSWAAGRTALPGGRTLVVSRGIGMERGNAPRIRFLCRPELAVIDVVPVTAVE